MNMGGKTGRGFVRLTADFSVSLGAERFWQKYTHSHTHTHAYTSRVHTNCSSWNIVFLSILLAVLVCLILFFPPELPTFKVGSMKNNNKTNVKINK